MQLSWHSERGEQVREHRVRVPRDSTVGDLLEALRSIDEDAAKAKQLRLLETLNSKIYRVSTLA